MKILHLFSEWKWTGPSEPIINLCKELEKRGHEVILAYRKPPIFVEDSIERRVRERQVHAVDFFHLNRPIKLYSFSSIKDNFSDIIKLRDYICEEKIDILNVHQSHDHILGGIAGRRSHRPVLIIRTDHKRDFIRPGIGNRILISQFTDGIITFSDKGRLNNSNNFRFPLKRIGKINPALDLERYQPQREFKDMRAFWGVQKDELIIGMVARFQKYRKTELFLRAFQAIIKEYPKVKLLLVGRSSQMNESVIKPMEKLGIGPWVIMAGYRSGDYIDTLACMDIFVFLMAGSDGTARALREAMAMGKPSIVADRGMLPELVEDGISGLVVKDSPDELSRATLKLIRNPELRTKMGCAAYEKAHREFRLDLQGEAVEKFYQEMIKLGPWKKD